ncbi:ABC transporter substrate-binding protein [Brachybacterium sp. p3-SID957]|uniref:peptide ABC transporter substrate-binding protein n=1 Tax=Brachybacterium sp. p3-SID957 TaxID=2916049 RepID=UPI00223C4F88|nr:ABC transporter substrate-binding protein [Brachybacterium sp. p3-SID957]MCT1774938.1 ABC transporter substrate-binding protein [Brachybacterium sp. p3-SID957]
MNIRRRTMIQSTALAGTATVALAACGGDDGGGGGAGGAGGSDGGGSADAVVTVNNTEPQNPLVTTNSNEMGGISILVNLYSGLFSYDAEGAAQEEMAESVETEDSQHYTITLKEGWTFTNGDPVTAQSFVDAWNHGANGANGQVSSYFFESIEGYADVSAEDADPSATMSGLTVVDDLTFEVTLASPQSDFPNRLGYIAYSPLPQAYFDDPEGFGQAPIGNGPYRLVEWNQNQNALLEVNPDYSGPRKPANGGLDFVVYQDPETAYNDMLSGSLDVLDSIPPSARSSYQDELGDRAVSKPAATITFFGIHMEDPDYTGEAGMLRRQAISRAIDRQTICDTIFHGTTSPSTDFISPAVAGHSESIPGSEVLQYDEAEAKRLWEEAEAIQPFQGPFTLSYNADGSHQEWVEAICNGLKNVLGIEAQGNSFPDFKSLREATTGRTITGAFRSSWVADYPSMYNFLGPLYSSAAAEGRGSNNWDYMNPEFDEMLQEGLSATSEEESLRIGQQAQELLLRDLPGIPLWFNSVSAGYSETVDNVEFSWDSQPIYYQITKQA